MIGSGPDLAFTISKLSQHAESPSKFHRVSAKQVLRSLNSTRDYGIAFDGNKLLASEGFSDADWAKRKISRKPTSGFLFLAATGAVYWRYRKQTCVVISTYEAEYIVICMAVKYRGSPD